MKIKVVAKSTFGEWQRLHVEVSGSHRCSRCCAAGPTGDHTLLLSFLSWIRAVLIVSHSGAEQAFFFRARFTE